MPSGRSGAMQTNGTWKWKAIPYGDPLPADIWRALSAQNPWAMQSMACPSRAPSCCATPWCPWESSPIREPGRICWERNPEKIWCALPASSDKTVDPENSRMLAAQLEHNGVAHCFREYAGVDHGVGLGKGLACDGWFEEAVAFWERVCKREKNSRTALRTYPKKSICLCKDCTKNRTARWEPRFSADLCKYCQFPNTSRKFVDYLSTYKRLMVASYFQTFL